MALMKPIYLLSGLFLMCGMACQHPPVKNTAATAPPKKHHILFTGDSGVITENMVLPALLEEEALDTVVERRKVFTDTVRIGKYYKTSNGNYMACITTAGLFEYLLLFEVTPAGEIVALQPYFHGNYACCYRGELDGFGRVADYFYIKTCGTGTAYCSSELYMFREVRPQDDTGSITASRWVGYTGEEGGYKDLTSTMEIKDDSIIMHYRAVEGIQKVNYNKVKKSRRFEITYISVNGSWQATDTTALYRNEF